MPEPEQIRPYGPGRFATMVDAYIYELAQEGFTDEFTTNDGAWVGLLKATARTPLFDPDFSAKTSLNDVEQRFLRPKAGVIMEESPAGAVTMDYFDRIEDLEAAWEALKPRAEVALEADMDNAFLEMPEASAPLQVNDDMLNTAEDQGYQDAKQGARPGSTPSMARYDSWSAAWGYKPETHTTELGFLAEAWRRGVYTYAAEHPDTNPK